MSALSKGATRQQAFRLVVLPQERAGMIAIGVLAFIRGWQRYVLVNAPRTGNSYWVMWTNLDHVARGEMGVDHSLIFDATGRRITGATAALESAHA